MVLAIEVLNGIERREERMYRIRRYNTPPNPTPTPTPTPTPVRYRILRPTLHSSAKPQYTRYKQLVDRYMPLRQEAQAEQPCSNPNPNPSPNPNTITNPNTNTNPNTTLPLTPSLSLTPGGAAVVGGVRGDREGAPKRGVHLLGGG